MLAALSPARLSSRRIGRRIAVVRRIRRLLLLLAHALLKLLVRSVQRFQNSGMSYIGSICDMTSGLPKMMLKWLIGRVGIGLARIARISART